MGDLVEPHLRPKYQKDELCFLIYKYEKTINEIAKLKQKLNDSNISNKKDLQNKIE